MSTGIKVFNADGSMSFDSSTKAFSIYDVFSLPLNTAGSKAYPELAGFTIDLHAAIATDLTGINGSAPRTFSISYSAGYPIVSWTFNELFRLGGVAFSQMTVYVVITTTPPKSEYGFVIKNEDSELASSDFSENYAYVGDATLVSNTPVSVPFGVDSRAEYTINTPTQPIPFVQNIENQMATFARIWWTGSNWRIRIIKNTNAVPRVICFASSPIAGTGFGVQTFGPTGNIEFDSTKKLVYANAYSNYVVPSTAISNSGSIAFKLLGTTSLSRVGGLPANSASFCPMQCFYYVGNRDAGGTVWTKEFSGGVVKVGASLLSGWVTDTIGGGFVGQPGPGYLVASGLNRIYTIDASRY
jgi:hypothetical protein